MTVEPPREFLDFALKTADIHASRLRLAMSKLDALIPLSADFVTNVTEENLFVLELFSSRFAKLQDLMGAKVFAAVLEWSEEPGYYPSFLDKLHVLEKVGAISNTQLWSELRQTRNALSHEYPDDPGQMAKYFNRAYELAGYLLQCYEQIKLYIQHVEDTRLL
jgi:hypothetical protein